MRPRAAPDQLLRMLRRVTDSPRRGGYQPPGTGCVRRQLAGNAAGKRAANSSPYDHLSVMASPCHLPSRGGLGGHVRR